MLQRIRLHYKGRGGNSGIHSSFFRRSLILVMLITCLPTALIGFSLHQIGVNRIESEVNKTHQLRLTQVSKQLDNELSQLEVRLTQWALNPVFSEQLKHIRFAEDVDFTRSLLKTLYIMQETNPLIAEVNLYIENRGVLISSTRGVSTLPEGTDLSDFRQMMSKDRNIFWTKSLELPGVSSQPSAQKGFPYSLIHKLPYDAANKYGVLIVRLNPSQISSYLHEFDESVAASLFDRQGDVLIRGKQGSESNSRFEEFLKDRVMARWQNLKEDTFLSGFEGIKYSVSYYTSSRLGSDWIFATASDISKVSAPVVVMSRLILLISAIGFVTAAALSWFASRRLYTPIARLMGSITKDPKYRGMESGDELKFIEKEWHNLSRESSILQERVEEQLPALREGFMLQWVQGRLYYLAEDELKARMEYYGWETVNQQYAVLAVQLIGLTTVGGKFKEDDDQLVSFAAANIMDELTRLHMEQAYVINFQDLFVGIVIGLPANIPGTAVKKELSQLSQEIISTLNNILNLQVTVCIGQLSTELGCIPQMMEEARQTLRFRKLIEGNQIIEMDSLFISGDFTFRYPFEIEKELIHAIRLGQEEEAFRRAEEFVVELERHAGVELLLQQAMIQLIGNVNNTLLQAGFNVYSFLKGQNFYEEIMQLRQGGEMLKWFKNHVISPYVQEMNQTYQAHLTQNVEKVVRLVEEKYMTDLSLEECADTLGVNVSSLSKIFKQVKGINYVDYVTKVRIENSKKLLLETDMKISEIAEKVGYQHSWFNRVFKKAEGVTPTQYREQQEI
ncbi:helix-turn-helix domain-containing protein [Paenibacillus gansuensis]|uniref:Helix-turn-helix domain-containing protein n=1 Tax=Paenibacillus gansuensis TaxID=306542 RepID=A0ABW5PLN1_9BACL